MKGSNKNIFIKIQRYYDRDQEQMNYYEKITCCRMILSSIKALFKKDYFLRSELQNSKLIDILQTGNKFMRIFHKCILFHFDQQERYEKGLNVRFGGDIVFNSPDGFDHNYDNFNFNNFNSSSSSQSQEVSLSSQRNFTATNTNTNNTTNKINNNISQLQNNNQQNNKLQLFNNMNNNAINSSHRKSLFSKEFNEKVNMFQRNSVAAINNLIAILEEGHGKANQKNKNNDDKEKENNDITKNDSCQIQVNDLFKEDTEYAKQFQKVFVKVQHKIKYFMDEFLISFLQFQGLWAKYYEKKNEPSLSLFFYQNAMQICLTQFSQEYQNNYNGNGGNPDIHSNIALLHLQFGNFYCEKQQWAMAEQQYDECLMRLQKEMQIRYVDKFDKGEVKRGSTEDTSYQKCVVWMLVTLSNLSVTHQHLNHVSRQQECLVTADWICRNLLPVPCFNKEINQACLHAYQAFRKDYGNYLTEKSEVQRCLEMAMEKLLAKRQEMQEPSIMQTQEERIVDEINAEIYAKFYSNTSKSQQFQHESVILLPRRHPPHIKQEEQVQLQLQCQDATVTTTNVQSVAKAQNNINNANANNTTNDTSTTLQYHVRQPNKPLVLPDECTSTSVLDGTQMNFRNVSFGSATWTHKKDSSSFSFNYNINNNNKLPININLNTSSNSKTPQIQRIQPFSSSQSTTNKQLSQQKSQPQQNKNLLQKLLREQVVYQPKLLTTNEYFLPDEAQYDVQNCGYMDQSVRKHKRHNVDQAQQVVAPRESKQKSMRNIDEQLSALIQDKLEKSNQNKSYQQQEKDYAYVNQINDFDKNEFGFARQMLIHKAVHGDILDHSKQLGIDENENGLVSRGLLSMEVQESAQMVDCFVQSEQRQNNIKQKKHVQERVLIDQQIDTASSLTQAALGKNLIQNMVFRHKDKFGINLVLNDFVKIQHQNQKNQQKKRNVQIDYDYNQNLKQNEKDNDEKQQQQNALKDQIKKKLLFQLPKPKNQIISTKPLQTDPVQRSRLQYQHEVYNMMKKYEGEINDQAASLESKKEIQRNLLAQALLENYPDLSRSTLNICFNKNFQNSDANYEGPKSYENEDKPPQIRVGNGGGQNCDGPSIKIHSLSFGSLFKDKRQINYRKSIFK